EWYRAFAQDEKDNVAVKGKPVQVPVLYLRGDKESRSDDLETYLKGFRDGGLVHVQGQLIENCGHFAPEEQPDAVASALRQFVAASLPLSHNR
ncbi:MAG TPA: alpha/beta hydrolase, partial [Phototrophicaceae bacterium]|nr:alpha/beta hydrolase [Phototrophicaceae bacterium]